MSEIPQFLLGVLREAWKPKPRRLIADWAAENISIGTGENRMFAGQAYSADNTPWNHEVFHFLQGVPSERLQWVDGVSQPHYDWRELITIKPSQSGVSFAHYVAAAWFCYEAPGNLQYITDTEKNVKELVKNRIEPVLRSPGGRVAEEVDEDSQTICTKNINGSMLRFVGGSSASGIVSFPISRIFVDEAEIHDVLPQGSTIELAKARVKGDNESKVSIFSKPQDWPDYIRDPQTGKLKYDVKQGSIAYDHYLSGTQEKFHVPCPRCGVYQELVWRQMKIPDSCRISPPGAAHPEYDLHKVKTDTYYECSACAKPIHEKDKRAMVQAYRLQPTPLDKREKKEVYPRPFPGRRSIQFSDLYNFIFSNISWGSLMLKWLDAQGDSEKENAFYNDHLGLPRPKHRAITVAASQVEQLKGDYKRCRFFDERGALQSPTQRMPIVPQLFGLTVDKQIYGYKWLAFALNELREIYVLDWGAIGLEDMLEELENTPILDASGTKWASAIGLMDSGYGREDVYEYCMRPGSRLRPFRGAPDTAIRVKNGIWPQVVEWNGAKIEVLHCDANAYEGRVYRKRIAEFNIAKYKSYRKKFNPRIWLPSDTDPDFIRELSNMHEVEIQTKNGQTKTQWQKVNEHQPNDWGDCLKMAVVASDVWGIDEEPAEGE